LYDSGVSGRVFGGYGVGGFMGYWLRPRLMLFIDSRTEHYTAETVREYTGVNRLRSNRENETFLGLLDRRRVEFFVGTGLPGPHDEQDWQSYTTQHVDGAPGWLSVFRNFEQQVSMRATQRNHCNLARIRRFWAERAVPFDPLVGFDPGSVIRETPERAIEWRLVPPAFPQWQEQRRRGDEASRIAASNRVAQALALALTGAYAEQIEIDRALVEARPAALAPRRRLVYALLRLGRSDEAITAPRALAKRSTSAEDTGFLETALAVARIERQAIPAEANESMRSMLEQVRFQERNRLLTPLEVVTRAEIASLVRPALGEPLLIEGPRPNVVGRRGGEERR
jgi:hypothetical protein